MDRKEELQTLRAHIRTDSYEMSIWEWISLYEHNEMVLVPEFRRSKAYHWSNEQKTRFIEFILLGIPISPILVSQRSDGVWNVIDGLQRLATIYQFVGILKDEEGKLIEPLVLDKGPYISLLQRKQWDITNSSANSLSATERFYIKRTKMAANIIFENDDLTKIDFFANLAEHRYQFSS